MKRQIIVLFLLILLFTFNLASAQPNPYQPNSQLPTIYPSWNLVWSDEFNAIGKPNPENWIYENGFVRNEE
ncbi:MAG: hypothetical protein AUK44_09100 [Porphyromonadaceae bacterium CG2_30_38_12]|nr:MAG: hypothetical protein AUK44_09100 [Porphyromonadaceae bacterium CG2_30_38_12]